MFRKLSIYNSTDCNSVYNASRSRKYTDTGVNSREKIRQPDNFGPDEIKIIFSRYRSRWQRPNLAYALKKNGRKGYFLKKLWLFVGGEVKLENLASSKLIEANRFPVISSVSPSSKFWRRRPYQLVYVLQREASTSIIQNLNSQASFCSEKSISYNHRSQKEKQITNW